ncbi:MAG: hypothetical protein RLZZ345_731 [Actinomycetota bacterium]|jgi:uncharacterized protein YcaQ
MPLELSASQARVLSLRQLGVDSDRDDSVMAVVDRLGLLQVDSVNVFERAHYMPLFSRLGKFDKAELESAMGGFHPQLIEYWAHEASIVRLENWPLYRWRMNAYREKYATKWGMEAGNKKLVEQITSQLQANGPMTSGQFETDAHQRKGSWWGWSDLKNALEYMFLVGDLVSGGRDSFKRLYALPEQILPQSILDHMPSDADAKKKLFLQAARAIGVGTYTDIADWHRMSPTTNKPLFNELVEAGEVLEMRVDGWAQPAYVNAATSLDGLDAKTPGARTTILSPFDPVCWKRDRIERMFGFEYRIEIYTPEPKRQFGYYTLPILHNRDLVGRIDLKSDRQGRKLLAQASWHESRLNDRQVASLAKELNKHLKVVQNWQGLNETVIMPKGNLAELLG